MTYFNLTIFLFVIFGIIFVNNVLAANTNEFNEKSIPDSNYGYQVSIQVLEENFLVWQPICSGGIIEDRFIISAATCFVNASNSLKSNYFSVVASLTHLNNLRYTRVDITVIYLPGFEKTFNYYNLAVAKLRKRLGIYKKRRFTKINLPSDKLLIGELATVSGFGYECNADNSNSTTLDSADQISTPLLKYETVKIVDEKDCQVYFSLADNVNNICSLTLDTNKSHSWGVCTGEVGAPLVIDGTVVGVANHNFPKCEDCGDVPTKIALYTKVSIFTRLIERIIEGLTPRKTIRHRLSRHI